MSMAAIDTLFDELIHPGDIFKKHPHVLKIYNMEYLAIHPDYRGQGQQFQQFCPHKYY